MNKTALITGASRGIGAEIAIKLSKCGYNVVINYNNSYNEAMKVLEKVRKNGVMAIALKGDVSIYKDAENIINKTIEEFSHIDVLVNNAGIDDHSLITDISLEKWNRILSVNLGGVFNFSKLVLPYMIKRHKGKIVNISSIWGITGASLEVAYSASKAGIIGFTKALAKEVGPSGINVNCVAPGVIDTDMNKNLSQDDLNNLIDSTSLGKLGSVKDVANTVAFLCGEESDFITGQVISPNGGFLI